MNKYLLIILLIFPLVVKADEIELKYYIDCRFNFIQQQLTTGDVIDNKSQKQICMCVSREAHKGYPYTNSKREEYAIISATETCLNKFNFLYGGNTITNTLGDQ